MALDVYLRSEEPAFATLAMETILGDPTSYVSAFLRKRVEMRMGPVDQPSGTEDENLEDWAEVNKRYKYPHTPYITPYVAPTDRAPAPIFRAGAFAPKNVVTGNIIIPRG